MIYLFGDKNRGIRHIDLSGRQNRKRTTLKVVEILWIDSETKMVLLKENGFASTDENVRM